MRFYFWFVILLSSVPCYSDSFVPAGSWNRAKNLLDDQVYKYHRYTFYCGCSYSSHQDYDGSGSIDADACGFQGVQLKRNVRNTIQWEHVVPASLMPVGSYMCWQDEASIKACTDDSGKVDKSNRNCCEAVSPSGEIMIFDLHNLVPAAAQLNQYRSNDPYGVIPDESEHEGFGPMCQARDLNGTTSGPDGLFEPPDCKKGDVARIWFYMRLAHGVNIDSETEKLLIAWSKGDPVSPWEKKRHDLISKIQKNKNPYVEGVVPSGKGSCSWE
ncbi:endonuclease [Bacterioplanoides sp.]|uniref:endonuclease n=1 Tax=Bacterioplanoides sp. TaxID=2066072 RepID=UPI003B00DCE5